jgi:glucosamine--fructose-6-phosphate aminotransferase (isomerizing)
VTLSWLSMRTVEENGMIKANYSHYMLKEIYDEPEAVRLTVAEERAAKIAARTIKNKRFQRIYLTGCGSSYFAGMAGKYFFEEFAKVPSFAVPALEFVHYDSSIIGAESMVICMSQSGETIETLKALKRAKERGAYVLGQTNNQKSDLAKEADAVILTSAGAEIGPGTKTVVTQITRIYQIALIVALAMGSYPLDKLNLMLSTLRVEVPKTIARTLEEKESLLRALAKKYKDMTDVYIIGCGPCFPCALQASNLIKETSFIHAEAFSIEEFRHGPMEILDPNSVFIAINPPGSGRGSLLRLMRRVKTIGASLISLAEEKDIFRKLSDESVSIPGHFDEWQASFLYLPPLQLFAYYLAVERKINPDCFRNIRKTWTTE